MPDVLTACHKLTENRLERPYVRNVLLQPFDFLTEDAPPASRMYDLWFVSRVSHGET